MKYANCLCLIGLLATGCGQGDMTPKGDSASPSRSQASAPPRQVKVTMSGQVFVVTKGRDNIKLALVEVAVIPESVMVDHIQKKHAFGLIQQRRMEPQLISAMKEADASARVAAGAAREYIAAKQRVRAAWSDGPYARPNR